MRNITFSTKKVGIFIVSYFIVSVLSTFLVLKVSYARYVSQVNVDVTSTTGDMLCNVSVDTSDSYIENNMAYFRIVVSNSDADGNITATDVDYVLTISNQAGSNGLFYYIDSNGEVSSEDGTYVEQIVTDTYSFGKTAEQMIFKVYVKVESSYQETVNFNVNLDAVQKNMS